jgi:hypothetical protein
MSDGKAPEIWPPCVTNIHAFHASSWHPRSQVCSPAAKPANAPYILRQCTPSCRLPRGPRARAQSALCAAGNHSPLTRHPCQPAQLERGRLHPCMPACSTANPTAGSCSAVHTEEHQRWAVVWQEVQHDKRQKCLLGRRSWCALQVPLVARPLQREWHHTPGSPNAAHDSSQQLLR